jgi:hypothetical protein
LHVQAAVDTPAKAAAENGVEAPDGGAHAIAAPDGMQGNGDRCWKGGDGVSAPHGDAGE